MSGDFSIRNVDDDLIVELKLMLECHNLLWSRQRRREISPAQADMGAEQLTSADLTLYAARQLMRQALNIAVTLDPAIYDCVYLALALSLACPMVTVDKKLCNELPASFPVRVARLRDSAASLA
jgi:predicted nucleic acid-binding protein